MLTAWCKRTAFRRIQHIDRSTLYRDQSFVTLCIYTRHRTQKSFCIRMRRFIENIINRALFNDTACIHNGNLIADIRNNTKVMSDKNDSHFCFLLQVFHQVKDLCLDRNIQSCSRLIRDQKLRMTDQTHGDHNSLAHTTGELMRILFHTLLYIVDTNHFHHFHGTLLSFFLADLFIMSAKCFY